MLLKRVHHSQSICMVRHFEQVAHEVKLSLLDSGWGWVNPSTSPDPTRLRLGKY